MIVILKAVGRVILVLAVLILLLIAAVMIFLRTWPGVGKTPDAAASGEYEARIWGSGERPAPMCGPPGRSPW